MVESDWASRRWWNKDLTSSLLAVALKAQRLSIITGVDAAYRGFRTAAPEPIPHLHPNETRQLLASGELPPGSMGPKVEAALTFAEATGKKALITDVDHLEEALSAGQERWFYLEAPSQGKLV